MNKHIIHNSEYLPVNAQSFLGENSTVKTFYPKTELSGTEILPDTAMTARIKISDFNELCKIGIADGYPLNGFYELTADIDAGPSRELGFLPIGTQDNPFTGVFDGKNRSISNLYINRPGNNQVGLFGHTRNAEIKEMRLYADFISGALNVGTLVGFAEYTTIESCCSSGIVKGRASVGGLVGSASTSLINNCHSSCDCCSSGYRSGTWCWSSVGGLAGHAQGDTAITASRANGNVEGAYSNVGGLLGFAGSVNIYRCYSGGSVKGGVDVGGFVGNAANTMGRNMISDCYSIAGVSGSDSLSVGGFAGNVDVGVIIRRCYSTGRVEAGGGFSPPVYYDAMSNCFWDIETSNRPPEVESGNVTARSSAQMKRRATFLNWDFETVWIMEDGADYPKLRGVGSING